MLECSWPVWCSVICWRVEQQKDSSMSLRWTAIPAVSRLVLVDAVSPRTPVDAISRRAILAERGNKNNCPQIDWSKYVLKASVPPCPPQPDLSRYMLKTECPAPPDMSRYILKSAVPACPPCISTCNKPCKIGACAPCPPPPRCPVFECPPQKSCPPCASVEPPRCPEPKVNCKARYEPEDPWMVRPLMASISGL